MARLNRSARYATLNFGFENIHTHSREWWYIRDAHTLMCIVHTRRTHINVYGTYVTQTHINVYGIYVETAVRHFQQFSLTAILYM